MAEFPGYRAFLDWLAPTYPPQLSQYTRRRHPGTGGWFLNSESYQKLVQAESVSNPDSKTVTPSHTLFCPGPPGAGKTMLASAVIQDLTRRFPPGSDLNVGVAYVFCDFRLQEEQLASNILLGLLRQLLQPQLWRQLWTHKIYTNYVDRKQPSGAVAAAALDEIVASYSRVFVVVDALDECLPEHRTGLLESIFKLQSKHPIRLLATSDFDSELAAAFVNCDSLEMRALDQDVRAYLAHHLDWLPPFVRDQPDLQEKISDSITRAAAGR